jgi:hypothetical protein
MESPQGLRRPVLALAAILALATVTRLYRLDGPMADNLQAKQVYIANKARSIARPPFNPLRNTLDFLDDRGGRIVLTEEVPLYTGLLAAGYRLFGERDAVGHLLSLVGSLVAIAAFFDLARREHGDRVGTVATLLLASSPLFIFYGRAVLPDPWMLAGMLTCAACYRRHLDGGGRGWLIASALAGIAAGSFKYFGLMVLLPLADMTCRARGWRAVLGVRFVSLAAAIVLPIALWMGLVFTRTPNPVASGWTGGDAVMPYLIVQAPGVLLDRGFYASFFSRFLVRDCGPIAMALIAVGLWASARRRQRPGPVGAWTAMGLLFYLLLGPKLLDHDYYELMMLPAASLWAAHGWSALSAGRLWSRLRDHGRGEPRRGLVFETTAIRRSLRPVLAAGILAAAVVGQSPWVLGGMFRAEGEKIALAEALRRACPSSDRVVVIGPGIALATVVHYADREGWAVRGRDLPADWPSRLAEFRARGASCVGLYFDPKASDSVRAAYRPLIESLPVVARGDGPPTGRGTRAAYVVLRLGDADAARLAAWSGDGSRRR